MNIPKKLILLLLLFGLTKNHFLLAQSLINHLAFYVVNLEQSGSFYKEVIGLDTLAEPFHDGKHAWFKMGANAQLHIISGAKVKLEHNKNTHICFSVPSLTILSLIHI
jgi:lactoylglutathione lyase